MRQSSMKQMKKSTTTRLSRIKKMVRMAPRQLGNSNKTCHCH
jgi:hypothetical protein